MIQTVYLVSPLRGDYGSNIEFARSCMLDSLKRGEAPFAPHILYTQVLDDTNAEDRARGMEAAEAWINACDVMVAYLDRGVSSGMRAEISAAHRIGLRVEGRRFDDPSVCIVCDEDWLRAQT